LDALLEIPLAKWRTLLEPGTRQQLTASNFTRNGIPEGVKCEAVQWCDETDICATVCKRGSVEIDPWLKWAMDFQLRMARRQPLCYAQVPGAHNAAITLADGYGNRDLMYESYLRWLGRGSRLETNNQWLSLTDQLALGVRVVELDVHLVLGKLRVAHCGGFHSAQLDRLVALLNRVARMLGHNSTIHWDAETLGCSPSLSSMAAGDQRLFSDALAEISSWLSAPQHSSEFLVLFLDDQPDLGKWGRVGELVQQVLGAFPQGSVLTPAEARQMAGPGGSASALTMDQLVARGKRVLVMSGTDYGADMEGAVFSTSSISVLCNYTEGWMRNLVPGDEQRTGPTQQLQGAPGPGSRSAAPGSMGSGELADGSSHCHLVRSTQRQPTRLFGGQLVRMPACELSYGPLDCNFGYHRNNSGLRMDDVDVGTATLCGANFPSPDRITPRRAAAFVWHWAEGHPTGAGAAQPAASLAAAPQCVYASAEDGRWRSTECLPGPSHAACRRDCNPWDAQPPRPQQQYPLHAQWRRLLSQLHVRSAPATSHAPGAAAAAGCTDGGAVMGPLWQLMEVDGAGSVVACPSGYTHDIPHSAWENRQLQGVLQGEAVARVLLPLTPPTYMPVWLKASRQ